MLLLSKIRKAEQCKTYVQAKQVNRCEVSGMSFQQHFSSAVHTRAKVEAEAGLLFEIKCQ